MIPLAGSFDAHRDALAYVRATLLGDDTGRVAIASNTEDPVLLFEAMTQVVVGFLVGTTTDPLAVLDLWTQRLNILEYGP